MYKNITIIILVIILLVITGCTDEKSHIDDLSKQKHELNESNNGLFYETIISRNSIVESPNKGEVTYEISEKMIGRYEVVDSVVDYYQGMMFFEIKNDGTIELSLHTFSGAAIYKEELELVAFYTDTRVIISFRLAENCIYTFPGNYLSLDFEGDPDCNYFKSLTYKSHAPNEELIFVKQV
ncbi:MAG: hypothetical protein FWG70_05350 [Oscillospiraceae bacterium]|nr:hypothetical protein [Oscillospiraceae bacterium]